MRNSSNRLYFVTANIGFECVCAGHWSAPSPRQAIEEFAADCASNPHNTVDYSKVQWKARTSKAKPEDYALNHRFARA